MSLFIKKYKTSYGKTHCSIVDGYRVNGKIKHKTIKNYGYLEDLEKKFDEPIEFLNSELDKLKKEYDFILIDCPPSLSLIVDNALYASDSVIIPVECGYYSYEALSQMVNKITKIQKDKPLEIEGILLTKLDNRNTLGYEIVDKVKFLFPEKMFNTIITRSSHIQEAPMHGIPVIQFSYNSRGSKEYRLLAKEILNNNKKAKKEVK